MTTISRPIQALVHLIREQPAAATPASVDLEGSHPDVAALVGALAEHEPPVALGRWELGLLGEDHARKLLDLGGGGELATKYAHYRAIGQHNGEVHLVLGWSTGAGGTQAVLEIDPEYRKIESRNGLSIWLMRLLGELDTEARRPLREVFTALEARSGADLETADKARLAASRPSPASADALEAGGHLYFSVADDGTAVSVHKKGVRYIDAKGKRKAKNAKAVVAYGGIAPEGHAAWFLQERGPVYRVEIPAGKPLQTFEQDGVTGLAVLRDDRVVLRKPWELALCRLDGDQLEVVHTLVSLDLGRVGVIQPVFGGRGVVVSDDSLQQTWVFEVVDDQLVARYRLEGRVSDHPSPAAGVADVDADTALVETRWPHGRITVVPRQG